MCGIVGLVGTHPGEALRLRGSVDCLRHRGPDEGDSKLIDNVFLGHRRLKVIDLSPAAGQPMSNDDGSVWIIYNGEVYNYQELRERLIRAGHKFRSTSDTEVIIRLYEHKQEASFQELNGMYALAIYDRPRKKLLLARDRMGIKPLYYCHTNGRLIFASEIKAILSSGVYSAEVNWQGVWDYFTYLCVPGPQTVFRGIYQVPPASVLEMDLETQQTRIWPYWEMTAHASLARNGSQEERYEEQKEVLKGLLTDSVRRQMISDVPLGLFLSGGVDSPILAGLMAQESSRPVKTYTVVFKGKSFQDYNEESAARAVAKYFGTEHREISVDVTDPMEMLSLIEFFDQPFANPTFYLMYLISKHTRPEATVALCGAGGDELFAGYPRYRAATLARSIPPLLSPLLARSQGLLGLLPNGQYNATLRRARKFLDGLDKDFASQFVKWTYFFDEIEKKSLLSGSKIRADWDNIPLASDRVARECLLASPVADLGNRMLHLDQQTFLVNNILEYTDKMSMAVGLEVRVPYLDHRVVEHSLGIPFQHKLRGGNSKIILKDAFSGLLPKANRKAPKKGFIPPLAIWMRDHLDGYFDHYLGREEVEKQGIFNWEVIQLLRQDHRTARRDTSYELFAIIMFDVWYRKYMLQDNPSEAIFHPSPSGARL